MALSLAYKKKKKEKEKKRNPGYKRNPVTKKKKKKKKKSRVQEKPGDKFIVLIHINDADLTFGLPLSTPRSLITNSTLFDNQQLHVSNIHRQTQIASWPNRRANKSCAVVWPEVT